MNRIETWSTQVVGESEFGRHIMRCATVSVVCVILVLTQAGCRGVYRFRCTTASPDTRSTWISTSRALRRAIRWLPEYKGSKLEILIVTPSSIPDSTREALQEKGLKFKEIEYEFPDSLS
jgi:hypothetical protein